MRNQKKTINKKVIERDRKLIDGALKKYLNTLKGPSALLATMKYAVFSGGKRLRPLLTLESSRVFRGDVKKALPYACAVEFVHNFSLIQDDLPAMDDDDFRRGKPTCHKKFGEGLAILASDELFNLAFRILSRVDGKKALKAISLFSDAAGAGNMIGGQALDLKYGNRTGEDRKLKNKIDRMKTAALMALSCEAGALAADATPEDVRRMRGFGMNFGRAFQVADDIRDCRYKGPLLDKKIKEVRSLIGRGKIYLTPFGKNGDPLRFIADNIQEAL